MNAYVAAKRILIVGAGSYIGGCAEDYLRRWPDRYEVESIRSVGLQVSPELFENYDIVYNVAGIAHKKETRENRGKLFEVNRDLAVSLAKAAKEAGVKCFIQMSSFSVYGMLTGHIDPTTIPLPNSAYGESKLQADEAIMALTDEEFRFACLRSPMVYGKGCKGNYERLRVLALKTPFFPDCGGERSMIYIGNLCEFVRRIIDEPKTGVFFPQNAEYVSVTEMVKTIAELNGKKVKTWKFMAPVVRALPFSAAKKVFGSLICDKTDTVDTFTFRRSMELTEHE